MILTTEKLQFHLTEILEGIKTGDSLEGSFEFSCIDETTWEVSAAYRIGNLMGQGGMILIPSTKET